MRYTCARYIISIKWRAAQRVSVLRYLDAMIAAVTHNKVALIIKMQQSSGCQSSIPTTTAAFPDDSHALPVAASFASPSPPHETLHISKQQPPFRLDVTTS